MEPELVLGIDLGTTNSCVAVKYDGEIHVITDDYGDSIIPSYVYFDKDGCKVGKEAKTLSLKNPKNCVFCIKRLMGRKYDDHNLQWDMKNWPFEVVSQNSKPVVKVSYQGRTLFQPEDISAIILKKLREMSEAYLGQTVKKAVITVPAHFDDAQRSATMEAGKLAGLEVLLLLTEPTAAAIAYHCERKSNSTALVFDLGGGTFDISILKMTPNNLKVLTTDGDTHLGGEDFDARLVEYCIEEYKKEYKKDPLMTDSIVRRLKRNCEKAKSKLSDINTVEIDLNNLWDDSDFQLTITRDKFNEINSDYFGAIVKTIEIALSKQSMTKDDIDAVILVGGSSRIPNIMERLEDYFGKEKLRRNLNPDEAVAFGAAIKGATYVDEENACPRLCEVLPHTLGTDVSTADNDQRMMSVLLKKNTIIPCKTTETFCTVYDNQGAIYVGVYEGEFEECQRNRLLADFTIENLPKKPANTVHVKVTFDVDINGILTVSAMEVGAKRSVNLVISYSDKVSPQEIKSRKKNIDKIPVA